MRKELFFLLIVFGFFSCKWETSELASKDYPDDVGKIILTKCAVAGCHNDASYQAAGGLNLSTWDKLFEGGNGSACIIPYRQDFSTVCYYVNTFQDLGVALSPTMPLNGSPLSRKEVETIYEWIKRGAPDKTGFVKFSDNPNRKKYYVANQGCRVVTVLDMETQLPMRYIDIETGNASPHMIRLSPDKKFWYVISIGGSSIKKYRTEDDVFAGQIPIGVGNYNTFCITSDSKKAYIVDFSAVGKIIEVDLENMQFLNSYTTSDWANIHGSCLSPDGQFLYVTSQLQNRIFKIPVNDFSSYTEIVMNSSFPSTLQGITDPHEVIFSPDGSKYFVSCNSSNEVRVFDTNSDTLISTISTGQFPVEFSLSLQHPYLFVSCMEDVTHLNQPTTGKKGVISVINYNTNTLIQHIDASFYQPHGMSVDESKDQLIVASRNQETNGPAPHHTTNCGGRNGYLTFIQLNNLQKTGKRIEISVDPYSVAIRP
ncbi:MAG: YncE family protein [Bacteroidota bacterium]|jgi:DNA-binding beta-propeller fold protein YncE